MSSRSPDTATLVGRAIVIPIGEPWDFRSSAGDNLLTGRIVATAAPGDATEWLLCEVSPFTVGTRTISTVALVRRHAGEEPIRQLKAQGSTVAQVLYDAAGAALTPDRVRAILAAPTTAASIGFLVGSPRLS